MGSARKALLQILGEAKNNEIDLTVLTKELDKKKVLGFGVCAQDVVYALVGLGKVRYDREKEMVYLLQERHKVNYHADAGDSCRN